MKSINKVIKTLILADLIFLSAFGFLGPIFAVFVIKQIAGGSLQVVGFAAAIYWLIKSILQLPIGHYLDKNHGEKDDLALVVFGYLLTSLVPLGYLISSLPWHIYLLQGIQAFSLAMLVPAWSAIFTRHIDKNQEAFEWSLESTSIGLGMGITGALGGVIASHFGFNVVFIIVAILAFIGGLLPLCLWKYISPQDHKLQRVPKIHRPL